MIAEKEEMSFCRAWVDTCAELLKGREAPAQRDLTSTIRETPESGEDAQVVPTSSLAESRAASSLSELERRGILPTKECPVTYSALGKNGFGLFLYLEGGLDLQTLDRLAEHNGNRVDLARYLASWVRS